MTDSTASPPRRILLGIGEADEPRLVIEAAARLAGQFGASLECLLMAREDLMAAAGMPFAQVVGPGGLMMPLSLERMEAHYRRLARLVEQHLLATCRKASLRWRLERREGTLRTELVSASSPGDLVVIGLQDLRMAGDDALSMLRGLLSRASAVVVPGRYMGTIRIRSRVAESGNVPELARLLATALGSTASDTMLENAEVVSTRLDDLERQGQASLIRFLGRRGAGAIILPPSSAADGTS